MCSDMFVLNAKVRSQLGVRTLDTLLTEVNSSIVASTRSGVRTTPAHLLIKRDRLKKSQLYRIGMEALDQFVRSPSFKLAYHNIHLLVILYTLYLHITDFVLF